MRVADVQLSFPAILIALLIDGVARAVLPRDAHSSVALFVLIFAIGAANWVQYARTVRGSTMVEKNKEYVQAARVIGISPLGIMRRHLLPNVLGPVLVLATINIATAIITEATLSFLGVGVPPTQPSLGTLIRVGNDFLFSGEWWITIFPGAALVIMVLAINLLGDWLRDALNPKLREGTRGLDEETAMRKLLLCVAVRLPAARLGPDVERSDRARGPDDRSAVRRSSSGSTQSPLSDAIKIEPGRATEFAAPTRGRWRRTQNFMLDAQPCKRYYVNAQFATSARWSR